MHLVSSCLEVSLSPQCKFLVLLHLEARFWQIFGMLKDFARIIVFFVLCDIVNFFLKYHFDFQFLYEIFPYCGLSTH